jgi:large subunit ribosomal protein L30
VAAKKVRLRLTRSIIGLSPKQEATVRALGLRRINHVVIQADTPTIQGMIAKVPHVLQVTHEA